MKIYNEITKNILILVGFVALIISIAFLQKEIVEKIFIVSPFIILWLSYIREKAKEKRRTEKDKIENQRDIQYFFNNFIKWIEGEKERSSYLENYVLRKFTKYERIFGISILKHKELSPDEYQHYEHLGEQSGFYPYYVIYVLEGKYILDYTVELQGDEAEVDISFREPNIYKEDPMEWVNDKIKTRKDMIKDIIDYVREKHNIQLEYKEKKI